MNTASGEASVPTSTYSIRPVQQEDRQGLLGLVTKGGPFTPDEAKVALELIDSALSDPGRNGDYRVLVAALSSGGVGGYICYGPTPMTQSTWDLYWVATDADLRGKGIGGALCTAMEDEIRGLGGRLVRVETSTEDGYGAAHRFYERHGYPEACRVADFYRPGDDLILMFKRL